MPRGWRCCRRRRWRCISCGICWRTGARRGWSSSARGTRICIRWSRGSSSCSRWSWAAFCVRLGARSRARRRRRASACRSRRCGWCVRWRLSRSMAVRSSSRVCSRPDIRADWWGSSGSAAGGRFRPRPASGLVLAAVFHGARWVLEEVAQRLRPRGTGRRRGRSFAAPAGCAGAQAGAAGGWVVGSRSSFVSDRVRGVPVGVHARCVGSREPRSEGVAALRLDGSPLVAASGSRSRTLSAWWRVCVPRSKQASDRWTAPLRKENMSTSTADAGPARCRGLDQLARSGPRADYFVSDSRRAIQTVLGLIWLLDGACSFSRSCTAKGFIAMLTKMTAGQPSWLAQQRDLGGDHAPAGTSALFNTLFALVQVAIGLGLLYRRDGQAGAGGVVRVGAGRVVVWRGVRDAVHEHGQSADRRAGRGAAVRDHRRDRVAGRSSRAGCSGCAARGPRGRSCGC